MNAVDTNILLYVQDSREPVKQATADTLVNSLSDGVLLWQVAVEYVAASRKFEALGYNREKAFRDIRRLQRVWRVFLPTWDVLERADNLMQRFSLSFWDAMIVAACLENGVTRLYSEDFDNSAKATGLEIVNPFAS